MLACVYGDYARLTVFVSETADETTRLTSVKGIREESDLGQVVQT